MAATPAACTEVETQLRWKTDSVLLRTETTTAVEDTLEDEWPMMMQCYCSTVEDTQ